MSFESSLEKVFSHILEGFSDYSKSEKNFNLFEIGMEFQQKYESYFNSDKVIFEEDHFIKKDLH
jgi:hypothetical protein